MPKYHLNPLTKSPRTHKVAAFDVEGTGDPGGFILGVIYDEDGPHVYHDAPSMRDDLVSRKYRSSRLFAHNLEYDWGCLFQDHTAGWQVIRLRSRMIKCIYRDTAKHAWRFWDTTNLSAFQSVSALGKMLDMPKGDTPEWLKDDGTSRLSLSQLTQDQLSTLTTYCIRDAEIVYEYARFIQDVVNELGGELKATLASTAMDIFRRSFLDKSYKSPHAWLNELSRQAYYGGRTEVFQYGLGEGMYQYDVHSMYPAVMRSIKLPDPGSMYYVEKAVRRKYIAQYEGITNATVLAPDLHIPVLPVRVQGRLLFTTGTFTGSWCHNELRFALSLGYRIQDIHWQIICTDWCNPLRSYVELLYDHKVKAQARGNPSYFVFKILLNSLYGKFGQKCDGSLTRLQRADQVPDFLEKVGIQVIEWQGIWYVDQQIAPAKQPDYVIVLWAAYITAAARLKEYGLLTSYGQDVMYCDTDCVVGPHELPTSPELGGLGYERGPVTFDVRAEKYYRWKGQDDVWHYKKAGIPTNRQSDFWSTGRVHYSRPSKLAESMLGDRRMSVWQVQVKSDLPRYLKRRPLSDTWAENVLTPTRPWKYDEAVQVFESAGRILPWRDGRLMPELVADRTESRFLDLWRLDVQIESLKDACLIPAAVVFRLWDYKIRSPRRVRNMKGELTTWEYAYADDAATELGFHSGESLMVAVEKQAALYERIRTFEQKRKTLLANHKDDKE